MSFTHKCPAHKTRFPDENEYRFENEFLPVEKRVGGRQQMCLRCGAADNSARQKGASGRGLIADNWRLKAKQLCQTKNGIIYDAYRKLYQGGCFRSSIWLKAGGTQQEINEIIAEAKAQSGVIRVQSEYIFGYNTREAEDYILPDEGNPTLPITTPRKGTKSTTVTHQHESDEAILYRLLGGDKKEEDWRDFTNPVLHIVREYKPKLSKEIVADALGKLVQGRNSYKRRYGVVPMLEFITRIKVETEVLEDIRTIGAKAFQLTKENQLVEMA